MLAAHAVMVPAVAVDSMAFHRMMTACRLVRKVAAENPVQHDMSGEHEAAVAWAFVNSAYNGIEQALKMLLVAPAGTAFTLEQLRKHPYGHDLEKLYSELEPQDRDYIEDHFAEHWSLNEYETLNLGFDTAEEFIAHLNDSDAQLGLLVWRYLLLDMSVRIPQTNLWTMCEVWYAICCRIKAHKYGSQDDTFRLSGRLAFRFEEVILHWDEMYDGFTDDLNEWVARNDNGLSAWVDLLIKTSRGAHDQVNMPDRLRSELALMSERGIGALSREPADPDFQQFLRQVQRTDRDLVWNPLEAKFGWANNTAS